MNKYFYSLTNNEILYDKISLDEVVLKGNAELVVECNLSDANIIKKFNELQQKLEGRVSINMFAVKHKEDYIAEQDKIEKLVKIDKHLKKSNTKMEVWLNDANGEVENLVVAKKQIEDFAEKLNSFTYIKDGKEVGFSVLQKYFICYNFVANRVYNESENFADNKMRNWIGVLTSDKVICSGFSSLLKCVCDRVFDKNELVCYRQGCDVYFKETGELAGGHANNLVIINDAVLGVKGLFTSDACWGSRKERNGNKVSYEYCLNPITIYEQIKKYDFEFAKELYFYNLVNTKKANKTNNSYKSSLLKDIQKQTGASKLLSKDYYERESYLRKKYREIKNARREKIIAKNIEEFNVFAKQNNLENVLNLVVPCWYPENFIEKFPILEKYEKFFSSNSLEEIKQNVHLFFEFEEFYNNNQEIFIKLEQKAKEVDIYNNIFRPIKKIITNNCLERSGVSYVGTTEEANEYVNNSIIKAVKKTTTNNKEFFVPPALNQDVLACCFEAIARFGGIEDEMLIEDYVKQELERNQQLKESQFELTGVAEQKTK